MEPSTSQSKSPPPAQQWLIIGSLIACLLVGGGIIYWFVFGSSRSGGAIKVDPSIQKSVRGQRMPDMPGITRMGSDQWRVRGGVGAMEIKRGGDGKLEFDYWFVSGFNPSADQTALIYSAMRATRDDAMAQEWGVTPEQIKQIRDILQKDAGPRLTSEDSKAFTEIWNRFLSATEVSARGAAQKEMQQKLDEVAKAKIQPANEALERKHQDLKRILSAEQIEKMVKK